MRSARFVWTVLLLAVWAGSAHAAAMIGANGGLSYLSPKGGGDGLTSINLPGSSGFFGVTFAPGLRLGTANEGGNDFYVDFGLASASASGVTVTSFQATANYQRTFSPAANTSPFITAGIGGMILSADSETFTNAVLGGGLGVRSLVSQGHGAIRGELHVDYITEDSEGFVGGTAIGVKLGFDLYLK